jgi:hypothetical protein
MDQLEEKGNGFLAAAVRAAGNGEIGLNSNSGFYLFSSVFGVWSLGLYVLGFGFSVVRMFATFFAR